MEKIAKFNLFLVGILLGSAIVLLLFSMVNCSGSPLAVCNRIHQERCYDKDGDGIADVAEICDGEHWNKIMDCSEQWGADGEEINDKCVMIDNSARCKSR